MHLLEEILVGIVIDTSVLRLSRICCMEDDISGVCDNLPEVLLGQFVVFKVVGAPTIGCTVILLAHYLESQWFTHPVCSCYIAASGLITAGFQRYSPDESFNICSREVVLALNLGDVT